MLRARLAAVAVCWFGLAAAARAGLYNTAEPAVRSSPNFSEFRSGWMNLRSIGIEKPESTLRRRYVLIASLESKYKGEPTPEQRLNLSEYLVRLGKNAEAIQILTPAIAQQRDNFVLPANLGTAYQLAGQPERALSYLQQALDVWPTEWAKLSPAQLQWCQRLGWTEEGRQLQIYREAETYLLKLVRLRALEAARQTRGSAKSLETLDNLFDKENQPVRFVGENGQYEAGKLAVGEKAKLPPNAVAIVEQLLIWMPNDIRLYWLLAELLNAQGEPVSAGEILNEIVGMGFQAPDLRHHRQELLQVKRGSVLEDTGAQPVANSTPPADASVWMPNPWQTLGVGFGAGILVGFLGYWQLREMRRKKF